MSEEVKHTVGPSDWEKAVAETNRLQRELDIANADHIALWLEANTIPDEPMSQCISWLACRIVEAHERALSVDAGQRHDRLKEREAVVRWLRGQAKERAADTIYEQAARKVIGIVAKAIEAGEHIKETSDGRS